MKMMKRLHFLLVALVFSCYAIAEHITPQQAQQIAYDFMNAPQVSQSVRRVSGAKKQIRVAKKEVLPDQNFYICQNPNGGGFVIVSANDIAKPILGYSDTGYFNCDSIPENLRVWLQIYNEQISWAIDNGIAQDSVTREEWKQISKRMVKTATQSVGPLISTTWNQSPFYNEKCPYDSKALSTLFHAVTGCGPTAMAQVMKYWNWPITGFGWHSYKSQYFGTIFADFGATTYDWTYMPNSLSLLSTNREINAVATLMYHCGVSVEADYGKVSSILGSAETSATPAATLEAIKKYFRYDTNAQIITFYDFYNKYNSNFLSNWGDTLRYQLDRNMPILYYGWAPDGDGGHAFVCDGYKNDGTFHFNWGWGGNCDGYFSLTALTPTYSGIGGNSQHNYTNSQVAIIDIKPSSVVAPILEMNSAWTLSADSIVFGGSLSASVKVKNAGTSSFTGDIIALVLDGDGNYFAEYPLKTNYTIAKNSTATITATISGNASLVPGRYYVALCYKDANSGYQVVRSDYYLNFATFKVFLKSNIETYSNFVIQNNHGKIVQNELTTIGVTVKNTTNSTFYGNFGLVLVDPTNLSYGQDIAEVSIDASGIAAGETKTFAFTGRVSIDAGTYLLVLMYKPQDGTYNFVGSTYYSNPVYTIVKEPDADFSIKSGKYAIVTNRLTKTDSTWYYLTSGITSTTLSKQRLYSKSTGTQIYNYIQDYNLPDSCIWLLEGDSSAWHLKNGDKYITWSSGNTANLGTAPKDLKMEILDNNYVMAHFNDGTSERYLSLNNTQNYFAFYANKDQSEKLRLIPYRDKDTITIKAKVPTSWGNTISAWTWGENNTGSWVTLSRNGDWVIYSGFGYEVNLVFVNGSNWSSDNNRSVNISSTCDACVIIGEETSGKRSYKFIDCPNHINVKAKMPNNWGRIISAWVWDENTDGEWVTLSREGSWYKYSRYCNKLNMVFVNGSTWSTDNNQTMDISTSVDACIEIGDASEGKRTWAVVDCPELPQRDTIIIIARRSSTTNWFYLTSQETTTSTKRLEARDTGVKDISKVPLDNLGAEYYWFIEETDDGVYLEGNNKFVDWKSGNSAIMTDTGRVMIQGNGSSSEYQQFYFVDNTATNRYLALNSNTANNYFAFYTGNDQKRDLVIIKKGGPDTPTNLITSSENNVMDKFLRDDRIYIQVQGILYDILGNKVR